MKQPGKIVTVIPSRKGSNRVPMKGMRILGEKTLIEHTAHSLLESKHLSKSIYINSDGLEWENVAKKLGLNFYERKQELATSQSMIDDYLYDFMCNIEMDYLAVVTPTAPFVSAEDFDNAYEAYMASEANTLISAEGIQTHCFYQGKSLNFSTSGQLPRSQDLEPIHALNFSIAIYDCSVFKKNYEANGFAVLSGQIETFLLDDFATIDIDEEKDFILAEIALDFSKRINHYEPKFSKYVSNIVDKKTNTKT